MLQIFVTIEFPMLFSQMRMVPSTKRCQKVLEKETYFITYCEYIRNSLLIDRYGKKEDHVISIPHINNAMNTYLEIDVDKKKLNTQKDLTTAFAKAVIRVAKYHYRVSPADYMNTFCTDGMKYIFYSSQARSHKNILTLVKAYEHLLRHKYAKIKLVLTGIIRCRILKKSTHMSWSTGFSMIFYASTMSRPRSWLLYTSVRNWWSIPLSMKVVFLLPLEKECPLEPHLL